MKRLLLLSPLLLLAAGCTTSPNRYWDHWNSDYISPALEGWLFHYDADKDVQYTTRIRKDAHQLDWWFRRYWLNWNPDNPFQAPPGSYMRHRVPD